VVFVQDPARRPRRRRRRRSEESRRPWRALLLVVVLGLGAAAALSAPVRSIHVKDSPVAQPTALRSILLPALEQRLLLLDTGALREDIERDPWVGEARFVRRLPGRLTVVLTPNDPLYRLDPRGGAVDGLGRVLPAREGFDVSALPRLRGMPLEDGYVAEPACSALTELSTALARVPWSAIFAPREVRWTRQGIDLVSATGVTVRLGQEGYEPKLRRLAAVESQLTPAAVIDLRFDRQVVLAPEDTPPAGG